MSFNENWYQNINCNKIKNTFTFVTVFSMNVITKLSVLAYDRVNFFLGVLWIWIQSFPSPIPVPLLMLKISVHLAISFPIILAL